MNSFTVSDQLALCPFFLEPSEITVPLRLAFFELLTLKVSEFRTLYFVTLEVQIWQKDSSICVESF